jgi:hypothetical protein
MERTDGRASGETVRARGSGNRIVLWLLLEADRRALVGAILAVTFLGLVLAGAVGDLAGALGPRDPIETLFQALITAIVTGVTLVVTINQLVLSQELGAVGDQRERMEGSLEFRRDVEELLDQPVAPAEPAAFLAALVDAIDERAAAVGAAIEDENSEAADRTRAFLGDLHRTADSVAGRLRDARFGSFAVVSAALDFDYAPKIHDARRLRRDAPGAAREPLDELLAALRFFGSAREHVKTLYFQWELITLSRTMVYTAAPALAAAVLGVLYLGDPVGFAGSTAGVDDLVWVVSAATTVALAPFAVLVAYVVRIATVAQRTLAIGPFVLRSTDGDGRDDDE